MVKSWNPPRKAIPRIFDTRSRRQAKGPLGPLEIFLGAPLMEVKD
jgi:hypothetical protein